MVEIVNLLFIFYIILKLGVNLFNKYMELNVLDYFFCFWYVSIYIFVLILLYVLVLYL